MRKIGIIANTLKTEYKDYICAVADSLSGRAEVYMSVESGVSGIKTVTNEELLSTVDYMLVMGGDGTMIGAAGGLARHKIPVLGINLGRIGFMTEIEPAQTCVALDKLLAGDYKTEKRMMMKARIMKNDEEICTFHALNDIVVSKAAGVRLVGLELYTDGELVNRYIADGLILATPTGSTGYSISAGGPVVDPNMNLYVATPICAHMLAVRSAILPADEQIVIKQDEKYGVHDAIVMADGEIQSALEGDEEVIITRSQYELELIKIGNQSFYDTLIKKLS